MPACQSRLVPQWQRFRTAFMVMIPASIRTVQQDPCSRLEIRRTVHRRRSTSGCPPNDTRRGKWRFCLSSEYFDSFPVPLAVNGYSPMQSGDSGVSALCIAVLSFSDRIQQSVDTTKMIDQPTPHSDSSYMRFDLAFYHQMIFGSFAVVNVAPSKYVRKSMVEHRA